MHANHSQNYKKLIILLITLGEYAYLFRWLSSLDAVSNRARLFKREASDGRPRFLLDLLLFLVRRVRTALWGLGLAHQLFLQTRLGRR